MVCALPQIHMIYTCPSQTYTSWDHSCMAHFCFSQLVRPYTLLTGKMYIMQQS